MADDVALVRGRVLGISDRELIKLKLVLCGIVVGANLDESNVEVALAGGAALGTRVFNQLGDLFQLGAALGGKHAQGARVPVDLGQVRKDNGCVYALTWTAKLCHVLRSNWVL